MIGSTADVGDGRGGTGDSGASVGVNVAVGDISDIVGGTND